MGDCAGTRKLRGLLHAGVTAVWSQVLAAPEQQVATLDDTIAALRSRWAGDPGRAEVVNSRLRDLDAEVAATLSLCAERSDTEWIEPVDAISASVVALMQGTVLRWLADGDDEVTLIVLDDLVSILLTKAVES